MEATEQTLGERINETLARLAKAAKAGNQHAARKIIADLLTSQVGPDLAAEHDSRLAAIGNDTSALCRYLGSIGEVKRDVEARLTRPVNEAERKAWEEGNRDRRTRVRAVELGMALRGEAKIRGWMSG